MVIFWTAAILAGATQLQSIKKNLDIYGTDRQVADLSRTRLKGLVICSDLIFKVSKRILYARFTRTVQVQFAGMCRC